MRERKDKISSRAADHDRLAKIRCRRVIVESKHLKGWDLMRDGDPEVNYPIEIGPKVKGESTRCRAQRAR